MFWCEMDDMSGSVVYRFTLALSLSFSPSHSFSLSLFLSHTRTHSVIKAYVSHDLSILHDGPKCDEVAHVVTP